MLPYLSRYFRVVTLDFRGNGRSDRPLTGYDADTMYGDLAAVLEVARPPFALAALSCANMLTTRYAVEHPERLSHLIMLSPEYSQPLPEPFEEKFAPLIRGDFAGYLKRFWTSTFPEPHSLKGVEDGIAWGSGDDAGDPHRVAARAAPGERARPPRQGHRAHARHPRHP